MTKKVVLVVASKGFQEKEYHDTKEILQASDIAVITASDKPGNAVDHQGSAVPVDCTLTELQPSQYDAVFLIGGSGALTFLDNQVMYKVLNELFALEKMYGAICIAPRILAKAGVISGKKVACWDGDGQTEELFKKHGVVFSQDEVVVDGNIITANGPDAAHDFGEAIVKKLQE